MSGEKKSSEYLLKCVGVTILGLCWLGLGLTLFLYSPDQSPLRLIGAAIVAFGSMAAIIGFAFGTHERRELSALGTEIGGSPSSNTPGKNVMKFLSVVLLALLGVFLLVGLIFWWQTTQRKADTIGYAELNTGAFKMTFDLPDQWRISYDSRNRDWYHQGRVVDSEGRPRFRVYGAVRGAADLDYVARRELASHLKAGVAVEWSEFRDSPQGRWWICAVKRTGEDLLLHSRPFVVNYFRQRDGVHLEITMPADEATELEALAWRLVQSVKLSLERP